MVKEENAILPAQELRSLPPEQALSAKLLAARNDRKRGVQYLTAEQGLLALRTQLRLEGNHSFQTFGSPDLKKESLPHGNILRRTYRLVKKSVRPFYFRRMI